MNKNYYEKNTIVNIFFYLIFLITVLAFSTSTRSINIIKQFLFYVITLIFVNYIFITVFFHKKKIVIKFDIIIIIFIIYKIYLLLNIISLLRYSTFNLFWAGAREYFLTFHYLLLVILVRKFIKVSDIKKYLYIFIFLSFIAAVFGLLQYYRIYNLKLLPQGLSTSTFGNKNFFAGLLIMTIPATITCVFFHINFKLKILFSILLLFFIYTLLITFSRGAYIGFVFSMMFFIVFQIKNIFKKKYSIIILICILIIFIFIFQFSAISGRLKNTIISIFNVSHSTNLMRMTTYKSIFKAAREFPIFGSGYGTLQLVLPFFIDPYYFEKGLTDNEDHAHNELIQILGETGITGIVLFLWLNLCIFLYGFKKILFSKNYEEKILLTGLLSLLIAYFIHNLLSIDFRVNPATIIYYFFYGVVIVLINRPVYKFSLKPIKYFIIIFVLFSFFALNYYYRIFLKSQLLKQTSTYYENSESSGYSESLRINELIRLYNEVIKYNPYNLSARYKLAAVYFLNKDFNSALEEYNKLEKFAPHYTQLLYNKGILYYSLYKNNKDTELLNNAIFYQSLAATKKNSIRNFRNLSSFYYEKENLNLSEYLLKKSVMLDVYYCYSHNLRLFSNYVNQKSEAAIVSYSHLGSLQYEQKKYYEAINTNLRIIAMTPKKHKEHIKSLKNIGIIYYYNINQKEKAEYYLRKYLELSDDEAQKKQINKLIN